MELRRVGQFGLQVSRLGLGTMTWGRDTSPRQARAILRDFVAAGGNLVDTAPAYGLGIAEKILGKLIHTDINRDDVIISSKAGFGTHGKTTIDTSRAAMLDDLATTLRHLHTDHIDIWQVHTFGDAPLEETLSALDHAVTSGMTRYVGVSNFIGWQTSAAAMWQQAVPGRALLVCGQAEYSLLARHAEVEILPALAYHKMGMFAWSPLGRGVLTGKYRKSIPMGSRAAQENFSWFVEPYLGERSNAIVEAVHHAAEGLGMTAAQVAMLWVRDAPGVTAPLLGARTPEQLKPYLDAEAEGLELPPQIVSALDDITGGPKLPRA